MQRYVDEGRIAGMVTLIARRGRIAHLKAYGAADREHNVPMRTDTIFRLASTTKLITTVAVMQLMEEGQLLVTDPVSKFIPAFKQTTVAVVPASPSLGVPYSIVPSQREITIHDVLTKTSGIAYPQGPTQGLYEAQGLHQWYFADMDEPMCAVMERLAKLPFHAQPGERWFNGYTADILGCVIERISGRNLDEFFSNRIFGPLKMADTHFFLPKAKTSRLAAVYAATPDGSIKRADGRWTQGQGDYVEGPRKAFSGGAGLLSTATDYGRFLQMLLNGGELDGVRLLSPKTVQMMTENHVGNLYQNGARAFGFNVEVKIAGGHDDRLGSVGSYGWQGAYFPRFWVDPAEQMFAVFLAQLTPSGAASDLHAKFQALVYQALVNSGQSPSGSQQQN
jgi:CubicO group peptidase (beta-lactamase class C family)